MRHMIFSVAVLVALSLFATPAWAAEGDLTHVDPWAVITSIAVFVLLLVVLGKFAWKPILDGLQKREETIQQALDEAKEANEEAKKVIAMYEAKLDHAKEEAAAIAEEARKDGEDIRARIQEEARAEREATVARAKREIDQMAAAAWETIVKDAAAIATSTASQIVQRELDQAGHADIAANVVSQFTTRRSDED